MSDRFTPGNTHHRADAPLLLDEVFASGSHVRVLRAIYANGNLSWASVIARETGLSRGGTWKALRRLVSTGLVQVAGPWRHGAALPYRIARTHRLTTPLIDLFEAESHCSADEPRGRHHLDEWM